MITNFLNKIFRKVKRESKVVAATTEAKRMKTVDMTNIKQEKEDQVKASLNAWLQLTCKPYQPITSVSIEFSPDFTISKVIVQCPYCPRSVSLSIDKTRTPGKIQTDNYKRHIKTYHCKKGASSEPQNQPKISAFLSKVQESSNNATSSHSASEIPTEFSNNSAIGGKSGVKILEDMQICSKN